MAGKGSAFIRLAKFLGPVVIGLLTQVWNNPQVRTRVLEQAETLFKNRGSTPQEVIETIEVLRDQVEFLERSADDEAEAQRAKAWAAQLEKYDRAAQLLTAPGSSAADVKSLRKKVDALRTEILEAFVAEQDEDAKKGEIDKG
ncbi:hypothetical protein [Brachybacterium squillarum]|uniref:hypothetical protein n=1 Tax=Brachybacterium squillarum TaxID=661979 RepID=UPI00026299BC|nr:hypothetical protein [Brachybacterium squillarum]